MGIKDLIKAVGGLINYALGLMVALALLTFFWGVVKGLIAMNQGGKTDEAKSIMKWGLISLFVMVSVWGIIGFVQSAFGLPKTVWTGPAYATPTLGGWKNPPIFGETYPTPYPTPTLGGWKSSVFGQ